MTATHNNRNNGDSRRLRFEFKTRDGLARICNIEIEGGKRVETPNLLPVINPNLQLISGTELQSKFGAKILMTNAYIIHKSSKLRDKALELGLHKLLEFDGIIVTDSGAFQSYLYESSKLTDTDAIIKFQADIGSDIGTVYDELTPPTADFSHAEATVTKTIMRTRQALNLKTALGLKLGLAAPIQGGIYPELRANCAKALAELNCDLYPIGGVVPLLENYRFAELVDIIIAVKQQLPAGYPVHLFGAGHPMVFALAVSLGCDLFDSAAYAKYARTDRLLTVEGTKHLNSILELDCICPVCSKFTPQELKELDADELRVKKLAEHNLYVCFSELKTIRNAIREGTLPELLYQRCNAHPYLKLAYKRLFKYISYIEQFEPLSRKRLFVPEPQTLHFRLARDRLSRRLNERYLKLARQQQQQQQQQKPLVVLLPEEPVIKADSLPTTYYHELITKFIRAGIIYPKFLFQHTLYGLVPIELTETYPIAQTVYEPELISTPFRNYQFITEYFFEEVRCQSDSSGSGDGSSSSSDDDENHHYFTHNDDILNYWKLLGIATYQFGFEASKYLLSGKLKFIKSVRTGRIRNVIDAENNQHLFSLRPDDGLIALKPAGAERLRIHFKPPKFRVIVSDDSAEFNRLGRNVFVKFVIDADPELLPNDEVLVVDSSDRLVAVGRILLRIDEMRTYRYGVAVKVREGVSSSTTTTVVREDRAL